MSAAANPRHPSVISGAIREQVERLAQFDGHLFNTDRLIALCDELDQSLNIQQFSSSLNVISHPEQASSPSSGSTQRNEGGRQTNVTEGRCTFCGRRDGKHMLGCELNPRGRKTSRRGVNAGAWFGRQSFNGGTR